jgi:hypothetical protein
MTAARPVKAFLSVSNCWYLSSRDHSSRRSTSGNSDLHRARSQQAVRFPRTRCLPSRCVGRVRRHGLALETLLLQLQGLGPQKSPLGRQQLQVPNDRGTDLAPTLAVASGDDGGCGGRISTPGRGWYYRWGAGGYASSSDERDNGDAEHQSFEQPGQEAAGHASSGTGSDASDHEQLLRKMNRPVESVPRELFTLDLKTAQTYLVATASGLPRFLTDRFPAWQAKMLADPNFFFKLVMEETVGMGLCLTGVVLARGDRLMKELDFVLIDTLVGAALSFVLLWLLAPSATMQSLHQRHLSSSSNAGPVSALQRYFRTLPSCALAPASSATSYSWSQRAVAFLYKGSLFAIAGFMASVIGTSMGYALLALRKRLTGKEPENRMPPVLIMSLGWASFMFVSANPRYQVVTAAELFIYEKASPAVAKASTAILRTVNSIAGGATWVLWARAFGLNQ